MRIFIIVLNWNCEKYISDCLYSLQKLKTGNYKVETVVVDNASSDNSVKLIKDKFPWVKVILNSQNLGYAGGNNVGLKYGLKNKADFIWVVNPDVTVAPDSLLKAMAAITKNDLVGAVASKVYFAKGFEFHKDRYTSGDLGHVLWYAGGYNDWKNTFSIHEGINEVDKGQFDKPKEVGFATGSSLFFRAQTLQKVGLIDEKYFLYFEENDLCQRILKAGWKILYVPQSVVWHQVGQASGIGSPLADYYITRSRLLFGLRWAPLRSKLALLRESVKLFLSGRPWQKRGVIDFYLCKFGKGSYVN